MDEHPSSSCSTFKLCPWDYSDVYHGRGCVLDGVLMLRRIYAFRPSRPAR